MFINFLIMNWMFSMMFMFLNHPLSLGCILLLQTIIISLLSGFLYYNFWFSYILFLIMIGGMLVMFIYMTSIASNEKFKMSTPLMLFLLISMMLSSLMMFMDKFYSNLILNISDNQPMEFMNLSLMKFFNYPNMQMMIFLIMYLLITLIAVVKIVGKNFGPLRQK